MVAHVTVPALDPDPNHVATISPAIVSDLLEKQLGFNGIIVTDALDMAGLTHLFANNIGRAAVEAFKAGNDLLLIPADFPASYKAMVEAATGGNSPLKGVLAINDQPLVSSDFNHNPASSTFDVKQTQVMEGRFVRVLSWYDNEWGFSNRMSDTAVALGKLG